MRDHPFGGELLAVARKTLAEEVLPALPADRRLAGLMVANALGILGRELNAGEAPERQLATDLAALYDADAANANAETLLMRVARDLRDGAFHDDPDRTAEVHRILEAHARARVAESNPKYLGSQKP